MGVKDGPYVKIIQVYLYYYAISFGYICLIMVPFVKLRQGSGKDRQGMALKAKGLKASTLA